MAHIFAINLFESQQELDDYINKNKGDKEEIGKALSTKILLISDKNMPEGYKWGAYGNVIATSDGHAIGGVLFQIQMALLN